HKPKSNKNTPLTVVIVSQWSVFSELMPSNWFCHSVKSHISLLQKYPTNQLQSKTNFQSIKSSSYPYLCVLAFKFFADCLFDPSSISSLLRHNSWLNICS